MAFAFLSNNAFLKVPALCAATAARPFAIAGIAWDGCVTNRPGARFGPRGIRDASHMLCDGIHPLFDVSPIPHLADAGDVELPNTALDAMRAALQPVAKRLFQSHHMVWLGGDHSVTLPLLRALREATNDAAAAAAAPAAAGAAAAAPPAPSRLACIHFDAHCDTWTDHFGEPSGHGTWVSEAITEGLVDPRCVFQFGIRSSAEREAREFVRDRGGLIFTGRDLRGLGTAEQLKPAVDAVVERLRACGDPPVYITFDIDCLDPAFAPGTGTPEPGGLSTTQALTLIEEFALRLNCVGMDVVEVAPAYDHSELTTSAAAHLVWTYLAARVRRMVDGTPHPPSAAAAAAGAAAAAARTNAPA